MINNSREQVLFKKNPKKLSDEAIEEIITIAGQAAKGFISATSKFRPRLKPTDEIVDSERDYPDEDYRR